MNQVDNSAFRPTIWQKDPARQRRQEPVTDAGVIHLRMLDLFDKHDIVRLRETLHPRYQYTGPDGVSRSGPDAGVAICAGTLNAFPDLRITVDHHHSLANVSVVEFTLRGTNLGPIGRTGAIGKTCRLRTCSVIEVRDGKIYREREYYDERTLRKQLGLD
jgi:ketosteroid isomerase-like protein